MTRKQAEEVLADIKTLPSEGVAELREFIASLKQRHPNRPGRASTDDEWNEQDLKDITRAVWEYAETAAPWNGPID